MPKINFCLLVTKAKCHCVVKKVFHKRKAALPSLGVLFAYALC